MKSQTNLLALICACAAVLLAGLGVPAAAQTRPAGYSEFDISIAPGDAAALKAAILRPTAQYLYLQSGAYVLDNPVVIDRSTSLYIHGGDRMTTFLVAKNPSQPLFILRRAPLVNFAGVRLFPARNAPGTLHATALAAVNTTPTIVEILDSRLQQAMLSFAGPGTYHIQGLAATPGGRVRAAVIVDHPDADVLLLGGDITNGPESLRVDQSFHLWQKRGRLRVYATTFEAALGAADVRIERSSPLGAHVLGAVRSEGTNGALFHTAISRLLYVPPTSDAVDVVIKNSVGSWHTGPLNPANPQDAINCRLVWYNGAGTLWLLGNRADGSCGRHLVEGNAPMATIVSVGNLISSPHAFPVAAQQVITAADSFNNLRWTGSSASPVIRWIPDGSTPRKLSSYTNMRMPPNDALPAHLARPAMNTRLPGMINVKRAPYNARGDGINDDTAELQAALDAQCNESKPAQLYLPPGRYQISNTLFLNHHAGGTCRGKMPAGGWIAGAGSAGTVIEMKAGVKKGVFHTDGLADATVQGITFKTWRWQTGDPREPNVDIEAYKPGYVASQLNNFYDTVFDGGYIAWGTGLRPPTVGQCSSQALYGSVMRNANYGFVSGHYNAIANLVYDSQFVDNATAMAQMTLDQANLPAGGTFMAYRSTSRGAVSDFSIRSSSAGSNWHFYEWDSDAPSPLAAAFGISANGFPILFERSTLTPRAGGSVYLFDSAAGMGFMFLYSTLTRSGIRVGGPLAQGYAVNIGSTIADWASNLTPLSHGQLEQVWAGVADTSSEWDPLGPPGMPQVVK